MAAVPHLLDRLRAHFDWLDQRLADGRPFLQGSAPGLSDLAAYHPVWFLQRNFGSAAEPLDGFPRLLNWTERVAAIGRVDRNRRPFQTACCNILHYPRHFEAQVYVLFTLPRHSPPASCTAGNTTMHIACVSHLPSCRQKSHEQK